MPRFHRRSRVISRLAFRFERIARFRELSENTPVMTSHLTFVLRSLSGRCPNLTLWSRLTLTLQQTGTTMRWILYNLARNPEAQDRLREEVDNVFGSDGQFMDKQLNKIPYLKSCLKETMRWRRNTWLIKFKVTSYIVAPWGCREPVYDAPTHPIPSIYISLCIRTEPS